MTVLRISGKRAYDIFKREAGGHRIQRTPPTERRGRTHTSTITVAVLREPARSEISIRESDIEWTATRGSGAGGQNRNKTSTAVIAKHTPTGVTARVESERSQHQNKECAFALIAAKIQSATEKATNDKINSVRRQHVGTGERGDKIRTYRFQDDQVTDHRTGSRSRLSMFLKGYLP